MVCRMLRCSVDAEPMEHKREFLRLNRARRSSPDRACRLVLHSFSDGGSPTVFCYRPANGSRRDRLQSVSFGETASCLESVSWFSDFLVKPGDCGVLFFNDTAPTEIYSFSLRDALPI